MEINKLSQRLLNEGWTEDQTPPGCNPWNRFSGGWTYKYRERLNTVFETPCGLLLKRQEISHSGSMGYMGIEWTEENDNVTIICPYYDRKTSCELNHPALETVANAGCHYESLHFCAVHETNKPYAYESSVQQVRDLADQEKERLWLEFAERHKGRVCRHHCRYNRTTKVWTAGYSPEMCIHYGCAYCDVLQIEIDRGKKGNVFYDKKVTRRIAGEGLFQDHEQVTVVKGKRLLEKAVPLQICEAIAKFAVHDIRQRLLLNHHSDLFFNPGLKIEFLNFRAEKKVGRDLLQDLDDVESGIAVVHEADQVKARAEAKKQRRKAAAQHKIDSLEKKIIKNGLGSFTGYQRERVERLLGVDRCYELDAMHQKTKVDQIQLSLF